MKLATIRVGESTTPALVDDAGVHPIDRAGATSVLDLIREPLTEVELKQAKATAALAEDDFTWLAPVPHPPKNIFCAGLNYAEHVAESRTAAMPTEPVWFSKPYTSLTGHGGSVDSVSAKGTLDYEGELAVVLGGPARGLAEAEILDCVFGYTVLNDVSDRGTQMARGQWLKGKSADGYAPCGPWLVTADEIPDPQGLRVRTWVNDEARQDSPTSDMIFSVARLLTDLAATVSLEAGDVIATGTPPGVGMASETYLAPGDRVRVRVDGVGELVTTIR